ncbi:Esterase [Fusarium albosuccineum]|uniref:Esterase n=1 Tax=Fusarium albosuccineum TaxID=1237068 RepID=A0A8H4KRE8_9HYPO|nr:Esterase [Fusarium albosuccineum]
MHGLITLLCSAQDEATGQIIDIVGDKGADDSTYAYQCNNQVADVDLLLQGCPTLRIEKATTETIIGAGYRGTYIAKFPRSTHIIFYVHGGGFRGVLADIFAVGYDLAPENPYPGALGQVVSAFGHIQAQGKPILLSGDSAGEAEENGGEIIGACLFSPWLNLRNDSESYCRNANDDCLDKAALDRWREAYLNGEPLDEYSNPVECLNGWKDILPQRTMLVSGDLDSFVTDVKNLASSITKDGYHNLDIYISTGHVWNLVDFGGTLPGRPSLEETKERTEIYCGVQLHAKWVADRCA